MEDNQPNEETTREEMKVALARMTEKSPRMLIDEYDMQCTV